VLHLIGLEKCTKDDDWHRCASFVAPQEAMATVRFLAPSRSTWRRGGGVGCTGPPARPLRLRPRRGVLDVCAERGAAVARVRVLVSAAQARCSVLVVVLPLFIWHSAVLFGFSLSQIWLSRLLDIAVDVLRRHSFAEGVFVFLKPGLDVCTRCACWMLLVCLVAKVSAASVIAGPPLVCCPGGKCLWDMCLGSEARDLFESGRGVVQKGES